MKLQSIRLKAIAVGAAAFALAAFPPSSFAQSTESSGKTIIILDASGSMWGQIDGKPKIEIAREAIGELLGSLDPSIELGLMAYGHRQKGDCEDIELLITPQKVDRNAFNEIVKSIIPKGKTPLTDAVEQAANFLRYEEEAANVILVSDGLETCDRDPCELASRLAKNGIGFRAHIVAFDLTAEESDSFRCLADETGGAFLEAQDAGTLTDALEMAVEAAAEPAAPAGNPAPMPEEKLDPATLEAPASVPAGSNFEVKWEGPGNKHDYITVIEPEAESHRYGNYAYTRGGSPTTLRAPIDPGEYEVRYIAGGKGQVLGKVTIQVTPVEATVEGPAEVVAGSQVEVKWTGPDYKGDYVTIVPKGAEARVYKSYAYTRNGQPASVRALPDPGEAEIRYVSGQDARILASAPITIGEANVLVTGPEAVEAGEEFEVSWKGPGNQGDYITVVKADSPPGTYGSYAYAKNSKDGKVEVLADEIAGDDYEIRYVEGQDGKTLAAAPLVIRPVTASLSAPETCLAGESVEIDWKGPAFKLYYITIVPKRAPEGTYENYFYTSNEESPTLLKAPETSGEAEIRFVTNVRDLTLATRPITILPATASFTEVPEKVAAGEKFRVKWDASNFKGDYISVARPDDEKKSSISYIYAKNGQDQDLKAPEEAGTYEVRYVTDQLNNILAKKTIEVIAE